MPVYWDKRKGRKGKRGAKGYYYNFRLDGVRYQGHGYLTKADAQQAEDGARREAQGLAPKKIRITFRRVATEYFRRCETHCTEKHWQAQWYRYERWLPDISGMQVADLTAVLVSEKQREWAEAQSAFTSNRTLDFLKSILRTGLDAGLIAWTEELDRILRIKRLPTKKGEKYIPPRKDLLKVYQTASQRDRCMIDLYLGGLARKRELFDLQWSDVDFEAKAYILTTRKTRGGNTKRTPVPMTREVHRAFSWLWANRISDRWVFPSPTTGEPYFDRNKFWSRLTAKAGVKHFSYHALRHYANNLAADRGASPRQSQQLCRHERMTTTDGYLRGIRPADRKTIKLVENPLGIRKQIK